MNLNLLQPFIGVLLMVCTVLQPFLFLSTRGPQVTVSSGAADEPLQGTCALQLFIFLCRRLKKCVCTIWQKWILESKLHLWGHKIQGRPLDVWLHGQITLKWRSGLRLHQLRSSAEVSHHVDGNKNVPLNLWPDWRKKVFLQKVGPALLMPCTNPQTSPNPLHSERE